MLPAFAGLRPHRDRWPTARDRGLSANAPLDLVLDEHRDAGLVCFVLDLFARAGGHPRTLAAAAARAENLIFSGQTDLILAGREREHRLRAMIARLAARLPPGLGDDPDVLSVLREGEAAPATVLHLAYRAPAGEVDLQKIFDFSRTALAGRWEAGARDMRAALRMQPNLPDEAQPAGLAAHRIQG